MRLYDWSPDGKWLAVQVQRKDRNAQIGMVGVEDGSLRVLKSVDWRGATKVVFSPDGKHLAFDLPVSDTAEQRDIFVLAVDGSREIPAVVQPSQDVVMGWSPDGTRLVFASDRTGSMGIWAIGFADGRLTGTPELIKADIGQPLPIGLSPSGALYYGVQVGSRDIEVASFDFAAGQFVSKPVRPIQDFVGIIVCPIGLPTASTSPIFRNAATAGSATSPSQFARSRPARLANSARH